VEIFEQMEKVLPQTSTVSMIIKVLAVMLMSTCSLLANTATQRSAFSLISRSDQHMDIRFTLPAYELNNQRHQGKIIIN
jgi:hypothetical protein